MNSLSHLITDGAIYTANKADKKALLRFYKSQHYSASFMGFDSGYIIKNECEEIIASVIVSQLEADNQQALLHGLVVAKQHRKKGLAKKLILHCLTEHNTIVCFAHEQFKALYQKAGFSRLQAQQVEQHLNQLLVTRFRTYHKKQPLLQTFIRR